MKTSLILLLIGNTDMILSSLAKTEFGTISLFTLAILFYGASLIQIFRK